jgi:phage tail-like protein
MDSPILLYARKGVAPQKLALRLGSTLIGRDAGCDLSLDAEGVAATHARIVLTPGVCLVTDLGGTTGTYLNQVRLQPNTPTPLRDGDTLRVGPYALRLQLPREAASPAQPPAPAPTNGAPGPQGSSAAPAGGVLPPEVARRLPASNAATASARPTPPVRRLPGNGGPPRIPPGARRLPHAASSYLSHLPPSYHEDEFLGRFLLIFESILGPLDQQIAQIHYYFDPRLAPEPLLPWLAAWVDLALNEHWPLERRRELIRSAATLYRWRGTRRGLREFIRIYAGVEPIILEAGQPGANLPPHVFKVILAVPDPASVDRALVEQIIEAEKPAHAAYLLEIR